MMHEDSNRKIKYFEKICDCEIKHLQSLPHLQGLELPKIEELKQNDNKN